MRSKRVVSPQRYFTIFTQNDEHSKILWHHLMHDFFDLSWDTTTAIIVCLSELSVMWVGNDVSVPGTIRVKSNECHRGRTGFFFLARHPKTMTTLKQEWICSSMVSEILCLFISLKVTAEIWFRWPSQTSYCLVRNQPIMDISVCRGLYGFGYGFKPMGGLHLPWLRIRHQPGCLAGRLWMQIFLFTRDIQCQCFTWFNKSVSRVVCTPQVEKGREQF